MLVSDDVIQVTLNSSWYRPLPRKFVYEQMMNKKYFWDLWQLQLNLKRAITTWNLLKLHYTLFMNNISPLIFYSKGRKNPITFVNPCALFSPKNNSINFNCLQLLQSKTSGIRSLQMTQQRLYSRCNCLA